MLLTKFSKLQIIHTAGTNLTVADMLSRDFSTINTKTCQLHHKTLPPHIDFLQLKQNNILKPIHYLVKHEDVLPTQKNDSHLILADYVMINLHSVSKIKAMLLNILLSTPSLFNLFPPF